ncbi:unnamed protein product [Pleuronectes platessa]|uniref:Uncharacterized protein n=1 Tax=Pleuronectes platessa TaxID=8262 RepID=A0A9N7ZCW1_PLEPL|nr:unnamed protein product [Pleuronectes platessa]
MWRKVSRRVVETSLGEIYQLHGRSLNTTTSVQHLGALLPGNSKTRGLGRLRKRQRGREGDFALLSCAHRTPAKERDTHLQRDRRELSVVPRAGSTKDSNRLHCFQ